MLARQMLRPWSATDHPVAVGTLRCREVFVPAGNRLGGERQAARIVDELLVDVHLGVAACAVGLARAALHAATTCVRVHGGGGAGDLVGTIGEMAAAVEAADAFCGRAAAAGDNDRPLPELTAMARIVACDTASTVTDRAAAVHGGATCAAGDPLSRYRREAPELHLVGRGDDVARRVVGREMVGVVDDPGR